MRHLGTTIGLGALLCATAAHAFTGTCTVTNAGQLIRQPLGNFSPRITGMVGMQFPLTIDEATGAATLDRPSNWQEQHFSIGIGGASAWVDIKQGPFSGTIDAGGNLTIYQFATSVATDFCSAGSVAGQKCWERPAVFTFSTGLTAVEAGGPKLTQGSPLDANGNLVLEGHAVETDAPGVSPSTSGIRVECTVAPVPSLAQLPKAAKLGKPKGKIVLGGPADASGKVPGDDLTLTMKFTRGASGAADPSQDFWVQLTDKGGNTAALLRVAAGQLMPFRKALRASDRAIQIVTGNSRVSTEPTGSLVLRSTKKAITVQLAQKALDLAGLSGDVTVGVTVGTQTASAVARVVPGKKANKIK